MACPKQDPMKEETNFKMEQLTTKVKAYKVVAFILDIGYYLI